MPAFNEEKNLPQTIARVATALDHIGIDFEIVVVDDGSVDATAAVTAGIAGRDPRVRLAANPRNLGIARTFAYGVSVARGDWVILIPADLAMDPGQVARFLEAKEGTDIVLGIRSDRRDVPPLRRLVSEVNIRLIRTLFRMPHRQFNYITMYRHTVFDGMAITSTSVFFHAEILIKARDAGYRIRELEVTYVPRPHGTSSTGSPRVLLAALTETLRFWWSWKRAA